MEFLLWLFDKLINFLTFPVKRFWQCFEKYKEAKSTWKILLLFVCSLTGVVLIGGVLIWLINYIFTYHFEWVVIAVLILWLYSYVKSRMADNNPPPPPTADPVMKELIAQAEKGYPIMRSIIFQTSKEIAPSIGANAPRLLQEVEVPGTHYIVSNGICFYQFKLQKADPLTQYNLAELETFRELFQNVLSNLIAAGTFPTLQLQSCMDAYGNWYDAVHIDVIEDIGHTFIVQSVFVTPAYTEYKHQLQLKQQDKSANNVVPDATWTA